MGKILKFNDRRAREIDQSKLLISYIVSEGTDDYGRRFIKTKWVEVKEEINLGSLVKPIKNIHMIRYDIPLK